MKKRALSILLILAMSATMLAGCKSGSSDKKSDSSSSDSTGGVTDMNVKGDNVTKFLMKSMEASILIWQRNGIKRIQIKK